MQTPTAKTTIATAIPGLRPIALTADDIDSYYTLVDRNRDHLSRHGDYINLTHATRASVRASLTEPSDANRQFGIWLDTTLIGRADMIPRLPGHFVLGYWLGEAYTGKGYATVACRALIAYAREYLGATAIFAGVTKGNAASEAVLGRLGFGAIADKGSYTRFKLTL